MNRLYQKRRRSSTLSPPVVLRVSMPGVVPSRRPGFEGPLPPRVSGATSPRPDPSCPGPDTGPVMCVRARRSTTLLTADLVRDDACGTTLQTN